MEDMILLDCMEGTEDAIVLCPVCGKIYSLKCSGIGYLRDYRKKAPFEFESSPLQIEDLVKLQNGI